MTVTSLAGQQALCAWDGQTQLYALDELDLVTQADDFPLGQSCDMSGDGSCEACQ